MNIEKELLEWAKETIKDYNETGFSYYTQSPLNQIKEDHIELLVLGINPGSGKESFEEMKNKKDSLWKELLSKEGMTPSLFLQGNPYYKYRNQWSFWRNFLALLRKADLIHYVNDDNSFAYSNIYCGSTENAKGLPVKKFSMHCKKLIDIVKPKRIICFGLIVMDELLKLYKEDRDCYVVDLPIRYKKFNNDMRVFGFHHPAYRYTIEEKELVGKFLEYYDKNDLTKVDPNNPLPTEELKDLAEKYRTRKNNKSITSSPKVIIDYSKLINNLSDLNLIMVNENHYRLPLGKNLEIKIQNLRGFTDVGIRRSSSIKGKGWVTEEMVKDIMPIIGEYGWIQDENHPSSWLAHLPYKESSEDKLSREIKDTILSLSTLKEDY